MDYIDKLAEATAFSASPETIERIYDKFQLTMKRILVAQMFKHVLQDALLSPTSEHVSSSKMISQLKLCFQADIDAQTAEKIEWIENISRVRFRESGFKTLSEDVMTSIFTFLPAIDKIQSVKLVSVRFKSAVCKPTAWRFVVLNSPLCEERYDRVVDRYRRGLDMIPKHHVRALKVVIERSSYGPNKLEHFASHFEFVRRLIWFSHFCYRNSDEKLPITFGATLDEVIFERKWNCTFNGLFHIPALSIVQPTQLDNIKNLTIKGVARNHDSFTELTHLRELRHLSIEFEFKLSNEEEFKSMARKIADFVSRSPSLLTCFVKNWVCDVVVHETNFGGKNMWIWNGRWTRPNTRGVTVFVGMGGLVELHAGFEITPKDVHSFQYCFEPGSLLTLDEKLSWLASLRKGDLLWTRDRKLGWYLSKVVRVGTSMVQVEQRRGEKLEISVRDRTCPANIESMEHLVQNPRQWDFVQLWKSSASLHGWRVYNARWMSVGDDAGNFDELAHKVGMVKHASGVCNDDSLLFVRK